MSDEFEFVKELVEEPSQWKFCTAESFSSCSIKNGEWYWVHDGLGILLGEYQEQYEQFEDPATGDSMDESEVILYAPLARPADPPESLVIEAERRWRNK